jgi:hypothetical protein
VGVVDAAVGMYIFLERRIELEIRKTTKAIVSMFNKHIYRQAALSRRTDPFDH